MTWMFTGKTDAFLSNVDCLVPWLQLKGQDTMCYFEHLVQDKVYIVSVQTPIPYGSSVTKIEKTSLDTDGTVAIQRTICLPKKAIIKLESLDN
jgi:hypothetical protein